MQAELTEFSSQGAQIVSASQDERYWLGQGDTYLTAESSAEWDNYFSETQPPPFVRVGDHIEVMVDHLSETNFFTDIFDDVQSGGLFVATYDVLSVGQNLDVRLVLPGSGLFRLKGKVSWVREADNCADEDISPGMGISFDQLHPAPMKAIEQFMSQREPLLFEMQ